jgi:hypothetical protein
MVVVLELPKLYLSGFKIAETNIRLQLWLLHCFVQILKFDQAYLAQNFSG